MSKQFYYVEFESEFVWNEPKKIIVHSFKELKDYVKRDLEYSLDVYNNMVNSDKKKHVKKIYKRVLVSDMFEDSPNTLTIGDNAGDNKIGKCFNIDFRDNKGDTDIFMAYYCRKIPKKDLWKFAEFKELEN